MFLRGWWTEKYRLPSNHELFQNAVPFNLLIEYYEDYYRDMPEALLGDAKGPDGEIVFTDTGDPLLDKWEEELAQGLTPDLEEGMSETAKEQLRREREKKQGAKKQLEELTKPIKPSEGGNKQAAPKDPRYESKFVQPGSLEEAALLASRQVGGIPTRPRGAQEPSLLGRELRPRRGR